MRLQRPGPVSLRQWRKRILRMLLPQSQKCPPISYLWQWFWLELCQCNMLCGPSIVLVSQHIFETADMRMSRGSDCVKNTYHEDVRCPVVFANRLRVTTLRRYYPYR
jgi:hypothetical protein